ncbi:hypothetical protein HKD37_08G023933 [Glycine soja]
MRLMNLCLGYKFCFRKSTKEETRGNQRPRFCRKLVVILGGCRKRWNSSVRGYQRSWILRISVTLTEELYKTFCNNINKYGPSSTVIHTLSPLYMFVTQCRL